MTAPNHLVGGFTFTGIFGSLLGINILSDQRLLPIILVACLLPDIDHTKSLIGKVFLPISRALNRRYGHRTITHSLVALVGLTVIISIIQTNFFPTIKIAQVFALAYGSHLLLDMVTVQGIPLFYPFKKNACVIPGRPELSFRSGNLRHEAIGMCMFTVSAIFMQPLMADGFWTSYNRLFGTLSHIVSEYNKSDDLMEVTFTVQHGSDVHEESGYCVAVSTSEITILDENNQFLTYPQEGQIVSDYYPIHTERRFGFESGLFFDISMDSLVQLYRSDKYIAFQVQGSRQFIHHADGMELKVNKLELEFSNQIHVSEIITESKVDFVSSANIGLKQQQILRLISGHKQKEQIYHDELSNYNSVKTAAELATESVEKELLMIQLSKMKLPKLPADISAKVATLEAEISALQKSDRQRYTTALKDAEVAPLTFSGSYEKLVIGQAESTNK